MKQATVKAEWLKGLNTELPSRLSTRHHVAPDTPEGIALLDTCKKASALHSKLIDIATEFEGVHGDFRITDERAEILGLPMKVKKTGEKAPYSGYITNHNNLYYIARELEEYKAIGHTKVATAVVRSLTKEWSSWFSAIKSYKKDKSKFKSFPRPPKRKPAGSCITVSFTYEVLSTKDEGVVVINSLGIKVPHSAGKSIKEIKASPSRYGIDLRVVYENAADYSDIPANHDRVAGGDLGLCKTVSLASNHSDVRPTMIKGGVVKSAYRKRDRQLAELRKNLPKGQTTSKKIRKAEEKCLNRVDTHVHTASRRVVQWCQSNQITFLLMGYNTDWKDGVNIGRDNNRDFTRTPHKKFIDRVTYKARFENIGVATAEESYTSKTSFLDREPVCKHSEYAGKRTSRGRFVSADGTAIHADIHGALNILRKGFGEDIFEDDRKKYVRNAQHLSMKSPPQSSGGSRADRHQPGAFWPKKAR